MRCCIAVALLLLTAASAAAQTKPADLRTYETGYYVIHTDLGRDVAREAELRLTRMAEEYRRRTSEFSGEIRKKLPFYLFKTEAAYHAAGGTPNTAGEYNPNTYTLMAFAGDDGPNLQTWHAVQHEGFHQFADQVIGKGLPIWANEGLAEYFAESVFTGDTFVPGIVPQWRLERIRATLQKDGFMPLRELLGLSHVQWNKRISVTHYDHVWSLTHFLVHAEGGALQEKFVAFLKHASGGADNGFETHVDRIETIEAMWRHYWTSLPEHPTADLYAEATLRTLTSFLARATARRQRFDSFDAFIATARADGLKASETDWLPPSLLKVAVARAAELQKTGGKFEIRADAPRPPTIVYSDGKGAEMVGRFTLKGSRVDQVIVERTPGKSP
jgi:hypothetical protein